MVETDPDSLPVPEKHDAFASYVAGISAEFEQTETDSTRDFLTKIEPGLLSSSDIVALADYLSANEEIVRATLMDTIGTYPFSDQSIIIDNFEQLIDHAYSYLELFPIQIIIEPAKKLAEINLRRLITVLRDVLMDQTQDSLKLPDRQDEARRAAYTRMIEESAILLLKEQAEMVTALNYIPIKDEGLDQDIKVLRDSIDAHFLRHVDFSFDDLVLAWMEGVALEVHPQYSNVPIVIKILLESEHADLFAAACSEKAYLMMIEAISGTGVSLEDLAIAYNNMALQTSRPEFNHEKIQAFLDMLEKTDGLGSTIAWEFTHGFAYQIFKEELEKMLAEKGLAYEEFIEALWATLKLHNASNLSIFLQPELDADLVLYQDVIRYSMSSPVRQRHLFEAIQEYEDDDETDSDDPISAVGDISR